MHGIGLHPAAAVAVVAVDSMLFGATAATLGIGWLVSIPVGVALGAAVTLVQLRTPGNDRDLAVGKGLIVAILTAIPTPLPSLISLPSPPAWTWIPRRSYSHARCIHHLLASG